MEAKTLGNTTLSKYCQRWNKDIDVKRATFALHFIKTGLLDKESGKLFGDLFDLRQKGDYSDFPDIEEKHVIPMIPKVEEFLNKIRSLLTNNTST